MAQGEATERQFPIVGGVNWFTSVPRAMLAKHEKRALDNHGLTLDQIERKCGGLTYDEALHIVEDRDLQPQFRRDPQAVLKLWVHVGKWQRAKHAGAGVADEMRMPVLQDGRPANMAAGGSGKEEV